MNYLCLLIGVLLEFGLITCEIPSYIQQCKRSDPAFIECVKSNIETLRPRLKNGIEELDVPGIDPLELPSVEVHRDAGATHFHSLSTDVKVFGSSTFQLQHLTIDFDKQIYSGQIFIPVVSYTANYDINTRVLLLPLKGKGPLTATVYNMTSKFVLKGQLYKDENNVERLNFTALDLDLNIDDYTLYMANLFNGDDRLGNATNKALNENSQEIIQQLKPAFNIMIGKLFFDFGNDIVKHYSYDEWFPK